MEDKNKFVEKIFTILSGKLKEKKLDVLQDALVCFIMPDEINNVDSAHKGFILNLIHIIKNGYEKKQKAEDLSLILYEKIKSYRIKNNNIKRREDREYNHDFEQIIISENIYGENYINYYSETNYLCLSENEENDVMNIIKSENKNRGAEEYKDIQKMFSGFSDSNLSITFAENERKEREIFLYHVYDKIATMLEFHRNILSMRGFKSYFDSFIYYIKKNEVNSTIRKMIENKRDVIFVESIIIIDLLAIYNYSIKFYCENNERIIYNLFEYRSTRKQYINLWSLIRTRLDRTIRQKMDALVHEGEYRTGTFSKKKSKRKSNKKKK